MKLIALETSAKTASAAVVTEGKLLGVSSVTAGLTHSQTILPLLETLLKGVSMELSDADGFAVSIGPGSFTGLRIGISAVKGMAQGLGKGCVGVSTLEGLAWNFQGLHYTVCPVMDARCGQVYTSLFWVNGGRPQRLWEDMAIPLDTLKEKLILSRFPAAMSSHSSRPLPVERVALTFSPWASGVNVSVPALVRARGVPSWSTFKITSDKSQPS